MLNGKSWLYLNEENWKTVVKIWKDGGIVPSIELGGLGPSYEQCIQVLMWEIMAQWEGSDLSKLKADADDGKLKEMPTEFKTHAEVVTDSLDKSFGFSGAQVGAAQATAFKIMVRGFPSMMSFAVKEQRHIQVCKNFPSMPV